MSATPSERLPTVFFGHGSPIIALQQNETTRRWRAIAQSMPRPRGILCISAHWLTHGSKVTAQAHPPTIHDFGGFPREMHEFQYPAPGDVNLCRRVAALAAPDTIGFSNDWGFDHGAWTVLMKAFPEADIPVVQLSLDVGKTPQQHFEFGRRLRPLRDEGVLILGSGNLVHNLRDIIRRDGVPARPYATNFSQQIIAAVTANDTRSVIEFQSLGQDALQSAPTPDHFWPLLYVMGARHDDDVPSFEPRYIDYGSIDMTTITLRSDHAA